MCAPRFAARPTRSPGWQGLFFLQNILEVGMEVGGEAVGFFLRRQWRVLRASKAGLSGSSSRKARSSAGFQAQDNGPRTGGAAARAEIIGQGFQIIGGAGLEQARINHAAKRSRGAAPDCRAGRDRSSVLITRSGSSFSSGRVATEMVGEAEIVARLNFELEGLPELHEAIAVFGDKIHFGRIVGNDLDVAARDDAGICRRVDRRPEFRRRRSW